jgi:2-(1,2-epoxy-1,2-dihydrophenyl)acetyl-CoA isomerase
VSASADTTATADGVRDDLIEELRDGVLWLTLNRPDAANSITPDQRNRLAAVLDEASGDLNVRAVVITANGKHFCTGADLRAQPAAVVERPEGAPERAVGDIARNIKNNAQRLISAMLDCEKPIICAVNGTAAGMGAHMVFASDLIIAADTARFIEVFTRRGIIPDAGGAYLLPRIIGLPKAKELMFFADDLSADDAERLGLVNKVVPADDLAKEAQAWAERLATGPTKAIGVTKWLLNRSLDTDRSGAFDDEAWGQEVINRTEDAAEGVAAFVERRDVQFKGW